MRWILKLELVRDDGITTTHQLAAITRAVTDLRPEEIGLTLEEGRALVQDVERTIIADQITCIPFVVAPAPAAEACNITRIRARNAFKRFMEPIASAADASDLAHARQSLAIRLPFPHSQNLSLDVPHPRCATCSLS
jgi:hypothetical protein